MILSRSLVPLVVLTAIYSIGSSFVAFHGVSVTRETGIFWSLTFQLMLALWTHVDRQTRGSRVPYEFDAFVFFAWPFTVPYYLYKTRGRRGLLLAAGIFALYLAPSIAFAISKVTSLTK